jgi:hypothetical protein
VFAIAAAPSIAVAAIAMIILRVMFSSLNCPRIVLGWSGRVIAPFGVASRRRSTRASARVAFIRDRVFAVIGRACERNAGRT